MKIHRPLSLFLAAFVLTGSLTACGAKSSSSNEIAYMETAAAAMDSMEMKSEPAYGAKPGSVQMPAEAPEAGLTSENTLHPVSTNRKLIRTVNLLVETTDFDTLLTSVSDTVSALGGYLQSSKISGTSIADSANRQRYAYLTARVPADQLDAFINQVDAEGNVTNRSENTQDVTLQYTDVESRKKALTIEQERLWALLEKADSVDAVIALESRLSEIRYQLESMESQLRTFDNQVDYSTVILTIQEVKIFTPTGPDSIFTRMQKGFQRNLNHVGNGMVNFLIGIVAGLPILIVLAVLLLVIVLIIRLIRNLIGKRRKKDRSPQAKAPLTSYESPFAAKDPSLQNADEEPGARDQEKPENK